MTESRRDGAEAPGERLREAAFEAGGEPRIVVDRLGHLILANAGARQLFSLAEEDVGRPLQDLELWCHPVQIRSLIDQGYADRRAVTAREVMWRPRDSSTDRWMDVEVTPFIESGGAPLIRSSLVFTDVTTAVRLQQEVADSKQRLETAYEELRSTNEELETTNEELQSTVEEMETTNEELQSTNEALETMNDELQSINEELQMMNDELRRRDVELNDLNGFLESIFASLRGGVMVIDRELRVLVWNAQSEDLWGLEAAEAIGSNVLALDIGLPVDQLTSRLRAVLSGETPWAEASVGAVDRRGRTLQCQVSCSPLTMLDGSIGGVIVMVDAADR